MTAPATECPANPTGAHDRYSDGVCAYCHQSAALTGPRPSEVARAFREGEEAAYRRVLAFLTALPEESATSGRDKGRGAAYAAQEIRKAVLTLAQDSGVDLDG